MLKYISDEASVSSLEKKNKIKLMLKYTEYAGLEISGVLSIALLFSRRIAIGNAGPSLASESTGAKPTFRCHFLNIGPSYKQ